MRVDDERDDLVKRSFAAGIVFSWLSFPENGDVLSRALEIETALSLPMAWIRADDRALLVRDAILHEAGAIRRAELTGLLRAVNLTLEDVDWRLLDHNLGEEIDDHGGPEE